MSGKHLSNYDFFARLSELFEERKNEDHGSIFLMQKRMAFANIPESAHQPTSSDPFPDLRLSKPLPILIRATNGKSKRHNTNKVKLSTIVEADMLQTFFTKYAEVCKSGMAGLKKRDRSKGKKKMKAKKKKVVATGSVEDNKI